MSKKTFLTNCQFRTFRIIKLLINLLPEKVQYVRMLHYLFMII